MGGIIAPKNGLEYACQEWTKYIFRILRSTMQYLVFTFCFCVLDKKIHTAIMHDPENRREKKENCKAFFVCLYGDAVYIRHIYNRKMYLVHS